MQNPDPYSPAEPVSECYDCGARIEGRAGKCPECAGEVKNISVPRE